MAAIESLPKWQRELMSFKGIKSTFIIEGNINDRYLNFDPSGGESAFEFLNETLNAIFNDTADTEDYDFLFCDPLFGVSDPLSKNMAGQFAGRYLEIAKQQREETESFNKGASNGENMVLISEIIRAAVTRQDPQQKQKKSMAVVVNFASRLLSSPDRLNPSEITMFLNLLFASKNAIRVGANIKTLVLIVDKFNDIPAWFYLNNPNVRTITIPNPDRAARESFISAGFSELDSSSKELSELKTKFIDITEGMKLLELDELRRLYQKSAMPISEITDTVSIYKYGFKENKWIAMRDRMKAKGGIADKIRERVVGQEEAVEKIVSIIKRSVTGLSGMQHSSGDSKPRGIMFLAGPTGTGKTEIVKTIAALLFGDEDALVRFDMSEYNAEHADQKLFGAPPGYVGYDQGGQLTNAVKSNPFSVLLFDEIEKAHPSIMDKFLQILEDGRMTDGQGNTVHFSETLIFFTSNAGISVEETDSFGRKKRKSIVTPENSYSEIRTSVEDALKNAFKPEILNRIGKNIIVFNYISEEATVKILQLQLKAITQRLFKKNAITITVMESAEGYLAEKCLEKETRENGGRGIGNIVESSFLNPLSVFMYDNDIKAGQSIRVVSDGVTLSFERIG